MNDATFDRLTRLLGSRPSRRQLLKGMVGGGTLAVAGLTRAVDQVAAQCLEDGETCTSGTECCGGACSASLGVCVTMDTCVADGDPCTDGTECCGGACSASMGVCVTMDCLANGDACTDSAACCSGLCTDQGVCAPPDGMCVADGQACVTGSDCCSGNCDATTGYCFTPTTTLPGTGSGTDADHGAGLLLPAAALGAAPPLPASPADPAEPPFEVPLDICAVSPQAAKRAVTEQRSATAKHVAAAPPRAGFKSSWAC